MYRKSTSVSDNVRRKFKIAWVELAERSPIEYVLFIYNGKRSLIFIHIFFMYVRFSNAYTIFENILRTVYYNILDVQYFSIHFTPKKCIIDTIKQNTRDLYLKHIWLGNISCRMSNMSNSSDFCVSSILKV